MCSIAPFEVAGLRRSDEGKADRGNGSRHDQRFSHDEILSPLLSRLGSDA
jgi:hypothetical protein